MKKSILIFSSIAAIMSSCSHEYLNRKIDTIGSIGTFQIGEKEEYNIETNQNEIVPVYMSMKIDSVIDDVTPKNPDALMKVDDKSIKVYFTTENKQTEMIWTDLYVFDTKTKKEFKPTLRDNESKFSNFGGYFIVDVPKATVVEDLTIGIDDFLKKDKTHEGYINLKPKTIITRPNNQEVKLDSSIIRECVLYGGGKTRTTLKSITYNIDDSDKNMDEFTKMTIEPGGSILKVDVEFELIEGEEASVYPPKHLFTQYREIYSFKETNELPITIKGQGTILKSSYYFSLWPGETIDYIAESNAQPETAFKINPTIK